MTPGLPILHPELADSALAAKHDQGLAALESSDVIEMMDCFRKVTEERPYYLPGRVALGYSYLLNGASTYDLAEIHYQTNIRHGEQLLSGAISRESIGTVRPVTDVEIRNWMSITYYNLTDLLRITGRVTEAKQSIAQS